MTNIDEGVEKREPLCTGNVNWCSCGKQYGGASKKKFELPYDLAIPLLGMYPEETKSLSKKYRHPHVHYSTIYNS